jgi:hypothetical protein
MQGVVEMQSLYFETNALVNMPDRCQVLDISPLMRSLMQDAVALPVHYDCDGRSGALMRMIQYEIGTLPELPLSLPLPTDRALARLCRKVLTTSYRCPGDRRLGRSSTYESSYIHTALSP